jgi:TrkA domain protein
MEIQETALPGVGLRQEFTTSAGRQLGVVSYRTGRRELLLYDPDDPDACREVIRLIPEEADALADLLGVARLGGRLAELQQQLAGLAISWLTIRDGSPYARGTIADTQARSRTGVSIVAVLREQTAFPAPRPTLASSLATPRWSSAPPRGSRRWPGCSANCHGWRPSYKWWCPVRPVGKHLRGQPAAAGPICSRSPDRPSARSAVPPWRALGPGCRLWDRSAAAAGATAVSAGGACRCRPGQGNAGRGHGGDHHRAQNPLPPRRRRTLALHRRGVRPGVRHHVDAPLDRPGGRDRRDWPGAHPRWRARPRRRLPQQPTPNLHGVPALTPPSTQSPR